MCVCVYARAQFSNIFQTSNHDARFLSVVPYEVNACIGSKKYYTRRIETYAITRISREQQYGGMMDQSFIFHLLMHLGLRVVRTLNRCKYTEKKEYLLLTTVIVKRIFVAHVTISLVIITLYVCG